jgi:phosphatidylglycerol---prolipoprotein diacylglyceryl transferase
VQFPVYIHIGPWVLPPHPIFESLAYFVGGRMYFAIRRRDTSHDRISTDNALWIIVGAVIGAAIGAKVLSWLENPIVLLHHLSSYAYLKGGQTIVGGLLGGLIGVELAKKRVNWTKSTGDDFVLPLIVGMCIGRVGCFLAGLPDHTYGTPTHLFTGVDFGDGISRHPTQLYEIAFLLVWGIIIYRLTPKGTANEYKSITPRRNSPDGARFQLFMFGYLTFRLFVEFIKPTPHVYLGFSNIQLACIVGMAYYAPKIWHFIRLMTRSMEAQHA